MDQEALANFRLELLILLHRHDHTPEVIIDRMDKFEDWCMKPVKEAREEVEQHSPQAKRNKKSTSTDILS